MSKEVEDWRPVVGYEGLYEVSDWGRVRSLKYGKERILYQYLTTANYYLVALSKNGKVRRFGVHRLVATAFIPNPDKKPQVDHISGVRTENFAWNLRWATQSENLRNPATYHKFFRPLSEETKNKLSVLAKQRGQRSKRLVDQIDMETGEIIKTWISAAEAGRNGFSENNIYDCLNGRHKSHKGFLWNSFKEEKGNRLELLSYGLQPYG